MHGAVIETMPSKDGGTGETNVSGVVDQCN